MSFFARDQDLSISKPIANSTISVSSAFYSPMALWPTALVARNSPNVAIDNRASLYLMHQGEMEKAIEEINLLGNNWDGYGATAIPLDICSTAQRVVQEIPPEYGMPDVLPNPNGTISLEWENEGGVVHLEVGKTKFSVFAQSSRGLTILREGQIDLISRLMTGTIDEVRNLASSRDFTISQLSFSSSTA